MRKIHSFILCLFIGIVSCSIEKPEDDIEIINDKEERSFSVTGLASFAGIGEKKTIEVKSSGSWWISSDSRWVTFTPSEGKGNASVVVGTTYNFGDARFINAYIENGVDRLSIEVTQEKAKKQATQKRVGDPDVTFDVNKVDENWPQMDTWIRAGVEGGIPFLANKLAEVKQIFDSNTTSAELATAVIDLKNKGGGVILLKNGSYNFTGGIRMYNNITIIGESRAGVVINLDESMTKGVVFDFYNSIRSGLRNLTIKGSWLNEDGNNYPKYPWIGSVNEMELPGNEVISISIGGPNAANNYVDNVEIINSARHPLLVGGKHNTIRDVRISGCFNKGGSYNGYFHIGGEINLVTGCNVTQIRHVSMQDPSSRMNVLYDNDFYQEVSFHNNDGGDNLVENNRICLPKDMAGVYCSIMGPWSSQHQIGGVNYIYRNHIQENNHAEKTPWSDPLTVYEGPWEVKPKDLYLNFTPSKKALPRGGTLYPVILN
ncbi:BACON domain-containing protein [Sphingobacterium lumbrici]|uniref:BACON domain-containing protein n=1 Tax=Sphingobacterium lumbrici TaxID=2559600 RepID=UPI001129F332|nr:BACON domain-containing protein [Sphingobacterium lumbrici]